MQQDQLRACALVDEMPEVPVELGLAMAKGSWVVQSGFMRWPPPDA